MNHVDSLLQKIYELSSAGSIDEALDLVFDFADDMITIDATGYCDAFLARANVNKLNQAICWGILSAVSPVKGRLAHFGSFKERIERSLADRTEKA
jgi:hypothetical protein